MDVIALRHSQFELGLTLTLFTWPDLTLAVSNNWGGPDSASKREWFAGAMSDLFPTPTSPSNAPTPELEDVEERLLQIMDDEFEVVVDDDSSLEVAEGIMRLWGECMAGDFGGVRRLQEEFEGRGARGGERQMFTAGAVVDQDTDGDSVDGEDWEGDEEDGDVEMGDAPPQLVSRREREAPEVDDEGFTTVRRRGR